MIQTYGTKDIMLRIGDMLVRKTGYIQLKEKYSLEGLDKNEEEE